MANGMYNGARDGFLLGQIDLEGDQVVAFLIDLDLYTPDLVNHSSLADVPEGARVAVQTLSGCSVAAGAFDADDVTWPTVTHSGDVGAVLLAVLKSDDAASPLLAVLDEDDSLPFTPAGSDFTITWDNGTNKVFRI